MLAFEQMEITGGIIALALFAVMLPFHILTGHYRHFAPLRDVQPILCICTHGGYFLFTAHLFFAWRHERELCYELAAMQLIGCTLLYGCFLSKHYALHKRYRIVSTQLPTAIVFILSAFPFLLLSTYRVATKEDDHCPNVDAVAGGCGFVLWVVAFAFFMLKEHPSSHYTRAKHVESFMILFSIATNFLHQWISNDWAILLLVVSCAVAGNASFLAYVFPPIRLRLSQGNEFTDEHQRILNDSIVASRYSGIQINGDDEGNEEMCSQCTESIAKCIRTVLMATSKGEEGSNQNGSDSGDAARRSNLSTSGGRFGTPTTSQSQGRMNSSGMSPARQRQEIETQQELREIISIIKEGDLYRLQKIMTKRGIALINVADENGKTLLHHAVRVGEVNTIKFLLAMGADTNKFDGKGRAPLHECVRCAKNATDKSAVITELLRSGAVVNLPTTCGYTALHFAVYSGLLGAINTLLRYEANPLFHHDKEDANLSWQQVHVINCQAVETCHKSPLTLAVEMGHDKVVSSMLHTMKLSKARLNFDIRCVHGMTLLHVALCLGNSSVVHVLLTEGSCSPWSTNEETNMNVFHMAAIGDSPHCISAIFAHIGLADILPTEETEFTSKSPELFGELIGVRGKGAASHPLGSLGSGVEHLTVEPISPQERGSRVSSMFGASKVQYGCHVQGMFGAQNAMGFGEAMTVLREHIPTATPDANRLGELEAAVDKVCGALRTKSHLLEVERLHTALLVVSKRVKMCSSRSLNHLYSASSYQGIPSTGSLGAPSFGTPSPRPKGQPEASVMERVEQLLRKVDAIGMTPLHYAIQIQNVNIVHIFAAYGAVVPDEELPSPSGSSSAPSSSGRLSQQDFGTMTLTVAAANDSPQVSNDTRTFAAPIQLQSSSQPNLEDFSFRSYSMDVRRYIDDEAKQQFFLRAIREGMAIRKVFLQDME